MVIMYKTKHSDFILSPLFDILENAISACRGMRDNMESYPLCEYVMQSLFLKLTGAQEQKLKCICWDIATHNYEYRYDFLNKKNYGEYSDWKCKNGVYNDLLDAIKEKNESFEPNILINPVFVTDILNRIIQLYENSIFSEWQNKELNYYKLNYIHIIDPKQIGQNRPPHSTGTYHLFQSTLKDFFMEVVYKHRNRCAHNTLSYQLNKPDLDAFAESGYDFHNYFFRFSIIVLIDNIFIILYKQYLSQQSEII